MFASSLESVKAHKLQMISFPFKSAGNKGLSAEISSQNKIPVQLLMHSALIFC
jgi:hypothetical protein